MNLKKLIIKFRRPIIVVIHLILVISAYLFAFYLRLDFKIDSNYWQIIIKTTFVLVCIKMVIFGCFGLYSGLWRYSSVNDIWRIIKANVLATLCFIPVISFSYSFHGFPRSIFVLDCILSFCLVAGIRFFTRLFKETFRPVPVNKLKNGLIIGAGESGVMVLRETRNNPKANIKIIGFIDDDPHKKNMRIQGVGILGTRNDIPAIVEKYGIDELIIAIPSAKGEAIRDIILHCQIPSVKIRIVPGLQKILNGDLEIKPRDIEPEDLLGRETVSIDECQIADYLKGKRVLITGGAGSIGSELCRQVAGFSPEEIILIDHNENNLYFLTIELKAKFRDLNIKTVVGDINNIGLLKKVFAGSKPQVVFHAAAYKHVPLMEENPIAAVKNNALGSRNMIYAAHHYNAERFVLISTDKAVNPISIMGQSKRLAEIFLQAKARRSKTKFMSVRFGNVLGSDGSVVPLFKKQIEIGGPITITHPDTTRYFMSIKEAVLLVLQAGAIGIGGEIFILDMGEQIKILDLARDLVTLSGLELGKDILLEYIGLRPGEKIKEELLLDRDKDKITKHNKIYVSQADDFDVVTLRKQMRILEGHINSMDEAKVLRKLRDLIGK